MFKRIVSILLILIMISSTFAVCVTAKAGVLDNLQRLKEWVIASCKISPAYSMGADIEDWKKSDSALWRFLGTVSSISPFYMYKKFVDMVDGGTTHKVDYNKSPQAGVMRDYFTDKSKTSTNTVTDSYNPSMSSTSYTNYYNGTTNNTSTTQSWVTNNTVNNEYDNSTNIGTLYNVGSGSSLYFNNGDVLYDQSSNTYIYETYNTTNVNNWNVDNRSYSYVTYNYNYTNVYYLNDHGGVTYDRYYFKLPDGRNSWDLKASEVSGLALDYKVKNYDYVFSDKYTRTLLHFDGDIANSSYYQAQQPFFTSGASYNFVDSGNEFDKCLYFGAGVADRQMVVPLGYDSSLAHPSLAFNNSTGMLQFKIYFSLGSGTPSLGGNLVGMQRLSFDSSSLPQNRLVTFGVTDSNIYLTALGTRTSAFSYSNIEAGVWHDICIVKRDYNIYTYLNGVLFSSLIVDPSSDEFSDFFLNSFNNRLYINSDLRYSYFKIDELRYVDTDVYDKRFIPSPVPYDTNNVLVLPEAIENDTIAVKTRVPVTGWRIGGVRPTFPDKGMVYLPVVEDEIVDCQVYNGTLWESIGCRLYVDNRWVSLSGYSITSVDDYINGGSGEDPPTGIVDCGDSQCNGGSVCGDPNCGKPTDNEDEGGGLFDFIGNLLGGLWKTITSTVDGIFGFLVETIGGLLNSLVGGLFTLIKSVIGSITSLISSVGSFATALGGVFFWLPEPFQIVLSAAFSILVVVAVIKLFF